jgi:hypothetical protein
LKTAVEDNLKARLADLGEKTAEPALMSAWVKEHAQGRAG